MLVFVQFGLATPYTCFYNWRSAPTSYTEAACQSTVTASNDPNNFVFFSPQTPSRDETVEATAAVPVSPDTSWTIHGFVSPAVGTGLTFNDAHILVYASGACNDPATIDYDYGDPPASGDFSHTFTGLTPATNYAYRIRGYYTNSATYTDQCLRFTTTPTPTTTTAMDDRVFTSGTTGLSFTGATLNGAYSANTVNGDELNQVMFVYVPGQWTATDLRLVSGYTQTAAQTPTTTYSQALTGLTAATTYSYQALGKRTTSPVWETLGAVLYFTTNVPDSNPQAFTEHSTVACGPPPVLTMNGIWIKGADQTGHTYVRFAAIQGTPSPLDSTPNDLRDNVGVVYTTLTDEGTGSTGTKTGTTFYNTASGNSYQFLARNGTGGTEQLGAVLVAPPGQCTLTGTTILLADVHDEDTMDLTISQAQCNGDPTSFSYDIDFHLVTQLIVSENLEIYSGTTGTLVLTIPATSTFANGNKVGYGQFTLGPGSYTGILRLVTTGVGNLGTLFDSQSFNVPTGACGNTAVDSATINTHTDAQNVLLKQNLTRIETTDNETESHADDIQNTIHRMEPVLNETEDHVDYIMGAQNSTRSQILASLNVTKQDLDDFRAQFNTAWSGINATCKKTATFTGDCEGVRGSVVLALNYVRTQLFNAQNLTKADIDGLRANFYSAWGEWNETEEHVDYIMGQNNQTQAMIGVITGSNFTALRNLLVNQFMQTNSYVNGTAVLSVGTQVQGTSSFDILIIFLIAAIGFAFWYKSEDMTVRMVGGAIVLAAAAVAITQAGTWKFMPWIAGFLGLLAALMWVKAGYDAHQKSQKKSDPFGFEKR